MANADVIDSFKHEPLDTTRQQIRLISINPISSGEIDCQLKNAYLEGDKTPDYRAVSYVWGPPTSLRHININGQLLQVRQNLYAFLEAFRTRLLKFSSNGFYEAETQWLWIDQICIDQTVISERNHQVKMMSEIYSRAAYVYVWLGPSQANIEAAMTVLKCGLRRYYEDRTACSPRKNNKRRQVCQINEKHDPNTKLHSQSTALPISALKSFFENPYWQRLWIVQEIMLARYIRIICGETLLSWAELRRFCLSSVQQLPTQIQKCVPQQMIWLAEHALSAKTYTYANLLATFSKSQCYDPKDKVYGLQGLIAPSLRVKVDYANRIEKVYQDAIGLLRSEYQVVRSPLWGSNMYQAVPRPVWEHLSMYEDEIIVTDVRLGDGLDGLNYSNSTEIMLQASSILISQIESIIRLPLITALVELGNQMGLPLQRLYATSIGGILQQRAKSVWLEIIKYYTQERVPALHLRGYMIYDDKEYFEGDYDPTGLIRDLWEIYEELEHLQSRFVMWIRKYGCDEKYVYSHMKEDQMSWQAIRSYNYLNSRIDASRDDGGDHSTRFRKYRMDLEIALEKVAFNIVATKYGAPLALTRRT